MISLCKEMSRSNKINPGAMSLGGRTNPQLRFVCLMLGKSTTDSLKWRFFMVIYHGTIRKITNNNKLKTNDSPLTQPKFSFQLDLLLLT